MIIPLDAFDGDVVMMELHAYEWFDIKGRGRVACCKLPYEVMHPKKAWPFGCLVIIDGVRYTVRGVETFMHALPLRKGEEVGILVGAVGEPADRPPLPPQPLERRA